MKWLMRVGSAFEARAYTGGVPYPVVWETVDNYIIVDDEGVNRWIGRYRVDTNRSPFWKLIGGDDEMAEA